MPDNVGEFDAHITETSFEIPENHNFILSPDELREKMGKAAWEKEKAARELRKISQTVNIRKHKTTTIILSRKFDLIQNAKLREHLIACAEDPKFKPTKEQIEGFVFLEHQEVMEKYEFYSDVSKQASEEHEMYAKQLSWYQSLIKKAIADKDGSGGDQY